jgi:hypothetical protein
VHRATASGLAPVVAATAVAGVQFLVMVFVDITWPIGPRSDGTFDDGRRFGLAGVVTCAVVAVVAIALRHRFGRLGRLATVIAFGVSYSLVVLFAAWVSVRFDTRSRF